MLTLLGRTLIVYVVILSAMRLLGKRQLGDLELSELVVTVLVADVAIQPISDPDMPLLRGLAPLLVLFGCELLLSVVALHNVRLRKILFGKPSMIIERGRILQEEMRKNRFTPEELLQELRNQGVMDIATVDYAILETSGQLNVILTPAEQPVTAQQMGIQTKDSGYYSVIITDGRVLSENLRRMGRDRNWLDKELKRQNAGSTEDVYLMMLNDAGDVYYAARD